MSTPYWFGEPDLAPGSTAETSIQIVPSRNYCVWASSEIYYNWNEAQGTGNFVSSTTQIGPICFFLASNGILIFD